ncbi:hypothetical protein Mal64_30040 [Pseudobythopirellula maris]|uniref:Transposase IS200 like protein n=1 Tax=Pseudobythopirellula maris TaxID=2527991 RepID=A0A5C5ZK22_9BACT|nr:hypothetical protein [Pseudobythopirellula maris]TWT87465.1 hypothetical protein Mal64_30040 [Pseudobythopirellula maris]
MPCYLFTFHAYGTWLPDKQKGYVVRQEGVLKRDERKATLYRNQMSQNAASFSGDTQQLIVEILQHGAVAIDSRLHSVATDPTHCHVLLSWKDESRPWLKLRTSLKKALSLRQKKRSKSRSGSVAARHANG